MLNYAPFPPNPLLSAYLFFFFNEHGARSSNSLLLGKSFNSQL